MSSGAAPDIAELHAGYRGGRFTVAAELERVAEFLDRYEPLINSTLAVHPELARLAADPDETLPLHGVPILVKDNIDTVAPLPTTAGSFALAGSSPERNAPLVDRLIGAGGLIVGKANLSEWSNFRGHHSIRGWSAVGGLTRNPHVLDRSAAGSSSGSAAAVAAGIVPAAIGTETDGSIIAPAEFCGIVGIKPTVGLIPGDGIVPISFHQDTAGPMARTVTDVALLLDVLAPRPAGMPRYVDHCRPGSLHGLRVGLLADGAFHVSGRVAPLIDRAFRAIADGGAELVPGTTIPGAAELGAIRDEFELLLYDFKDDLATYLAGRRHPGMATLNDVITFNRAHADRELSLFGQEVMEASAATGPRTDPEYLRLRSNLLRLGRTEGIDYAVRQHRVDLIATVGFGQPWKIDTVLGDGPNLEGKATTVQPSAVAGYPVMTVPVGMSDDLPVGICLFGPAGSEPELIRAAYGIEQALGYGTPPAFLPPRTG